MVRGRTYNVCTAWERRGGRDRAGHTMYVQDGRRRGDELWSSGVSDDKGRVSRDRGWNESAACEEGEEGSADVLKVPEEDPQSSSPLSEAARLEDKTCGDQR